MKDRLDIQKKEILMMSHGIDGYNRLSQNNSLKRPKGNRFKANNLDLTFTTDNSIEDISEEEVEKAIKQIRKKTDKERKKETIIYIIIASIVLIISIIFLI